MSEKTQKAVLIVMENGSQATWIGWAEDDDKAEGKAADWALEMFSRMQVYSTTALPDAYFAPTTW